MRAKRAQTILHNLSDHNNKYNVHECLEATRLGEEALAFFDEWRRQLTSRRNVKLPGED